MTDRYPAPSTSCPSIGVGTWAWGNRFLWGYDPGQDEELERCFHRAVSLGLHFFDTADSYGTGRLEGRSETLVGRFCAALPQVQRDRLTVATKLAPFPWRLGRKGLWKAFEASRDRLRGKLDRVQLHWSTARYAPWQEPALLEGLADLVDQGKVAGLGVSNMGPLRLREVHRRLCERGVPLLSLQVQLSLLASDALVPGGVADVCRELGIELIAYSPLALGLLGRRAGPPPEAWKGPRRLILRRLWPKVQILLRAMEEIGKPHAAGSAAVALNWCRSHGAMPIPGVRHPDQAEEVASALRWSLTAGERGELDEVARACGVRMPANPFQSS
jgi:pyridoxine 4-dehydrogenase